MQFSIYKQASRLTNLRLVLQLSLNRLADNAKEDGTGNLPKIDADGIFGSKTEAAVKKAQSYMGCTPDGKVGPHTKARLYYCAYKRGGWPLAEEP